MLKVTSPTALNLMKARALIEDESNWCRNGLRRSQRLCAEASLMKALGLPIRRTTDLSVHDEIRFLNAAATEREGRCAYEVNDELGHAATLEMFDRAIELALNEAC